MTNTLQSLAELSAQWLPVAAIDRSPLNPRGTWRDLESLAASIRGGQIHPVIVRPAAGGRYELADGERRWRAAKLAGVERIAARVAVLSDEEVFAIIFATGGEGSAAPLEPIEEAAGYAAMQQRLGLSVPAVAERCGVDPKRVWRRLKLLVLPERARTALTAGEMTMRTAEKIAWLPTPELREMATVRVLEGGLGGMAMGAEEAGKFIELEVWRDLSGAVFDPADPALVASAGACARRDGHSKSWEGICPQWAGKLDAGTSRPHRCTNPACFELKSGAARERLVAKHTGPGRVALTAEENAAAFPKGERGLSWQSDFVGLQAPVARDLLKPDVERAPKWAEVLTPAPDGEGFAVVVRVGVDQGGKVVELVERDLAIAAVKEEDAALFAPRAARAAALRPEGKSVREGEAKAEAMTQKAQQQRATRERAAEAWLGDRMRERVDAGLLGLGSTGLWRAVAHEALGALGEAEARWLAKQVGQPGTEPHTELAAMIEGTEAVACAAFALAALTTPRLLADGPQGKWARRWERLAEEVAS